MAASCDGELGAQHEPCQVRHQTIVDLKYLTAAKTMRSSPVRGVRRPVAAAFVTSVECYRGARRKDRRTRALRHLHQVCVLPDWGGDHDRVELTDQVHAILKQVVSALSRGQSISILTRDQEISTQQAAEILGLSRPTIVRLIDEGELAAHVPGAVRRKLRLADVLAYREELRTRRNRFNTESSAEYDDEGADEVAALLAEVRRRR